MNPSDDLRDKIARLPAWARDYIKRLETAREPLLDEAVRARKKMEAAENRAKRLAEQVEAMMQLLSFAAKGGHPDAGEYVRYIMAEYAPKPEGDEA